VGCRLNVAQSMIDNYKRPSLTHSRLNNPWVMHVVNTEGWFTALMTTGIAGDWYNCEVSANPRAYELDG